MSKKKKHVSQEELVRRFSQLPATDQHEVLERLVQTAISVSQMDPVYAHIDANSDPKILKEEELEQSVAAGDALAQYYLRRLQSSNRETVTHTYNLNGDVILTPREPSPALQLDFLLASGLTLHGTWAHERLHWIQAHHSPLSELIWFFCEGRECDAQRGEFIYRVNVHDFRVRFPDRVGYSDQEIIRLCNELTSSTSHTAGGVREYLLLWDINAYALSPTLSLSERDAKRLLSHRPLHEHREIVRSAERAVYTLYGLYLSGYNLPTDDAVLDLNVAVDVLVAQSIGTYSGENATAFSGFVDSLLSNEPAADYEKAGRKFIARRKHFFEQAKEAVKRELVEYLG